MYRVNLDIFEGPFDLLLYLIRKNEVDIHDIPIATITQEYVEMLEAMQDVDIVVAGEFLVMAAQLLLIKSRMLLPPDPTAPEGQQDEDPRAELVRKLLEYQQYKMVAQELQQMEFKQRDVFARYDGQEGGWEESNPVDMGELPLEVNLFDLLKAFEKVLQALPKEQVASLEREEIHTVQKMNDILDMLENQESISFLDAFKGIYSRVVLLTTFLAMLELTRLKSVRIIQVSVFGEIRLYKRKDEKPAAMEDGAVVAEESPGEAGLDPGTSQA
jgi:segregation and condensation protein A